MLYGRTTEFDHIWRLLKTVRGGRAASLLVRGEYGAGRSAFLDHVADTVRGIRVLRTQGVESETDLPYAGVDHLFGTGLTGQGTPEAVAGRLADLAATGPVLCLVDDAHLLDPESTEALAFAARRHAAPYALVLALPDGARFPLDLPSLRLSRLGRENSLALLAAHAGRLTPFTRRKIAEAADGNPLALAEFATGVAADLHRSPLRLRPETMPVGATTLRRFTEGVTALPSPARLALLVAAASGSGELAPMAAAVERLGGDLGDLEPAERAGLVSLSGRRLGFTHPLLRPALYQDAPVAERIRVHGALAEGPGQDTAHHAATAAAVPCDRLAVRLELHARRSTDRGHGGAALEHAAQLSESPATRARLLTEAVAAAIDVGEFAHAMALSERALPLAAPATRLELTRLRQEILSAGAPDPRPPQWPAPWPDPWPDLWPGLWPDTAGTVTWRSEHAGMPPWSAAWLLSMGDDLAACRWAEGLVALCRTHGMPGREPKALHMLAAAQAAAGLHGQAAASATQALLLAGDAGRHDLTGSLTGLLAWLAAVRGAEQECRRLAARSIAYGTAEDDGRSSYDSGKNSGGGRAGNRGKVRSTGKVGHAVGGVPFRRPPGPARPSVGPWALALLDLGYGRPGLALRRFAEGPLPPLLAIRSTPDLAEAAVHAGRGAELGTRLVRFEAWATGTGRPGPAALVLRVRALLEQGREADSLYSQALNLHESAGQPFELARTRLLFGEWLRRRGRRARASRELGAALAGFEELGARPWADRARAELRAGDARRVSLAGELDLLTPQELRVVRLAAGGATNRDIAAQLVLSRRTVGNHLYKAFPKLGVTSRDQLRELSPALFPQDTGAT
ncbi:LuxR C-terminal-related transcriptional regulator [Streptosporangium sp. NBC_01495]|uniref:helix-turn-helix transcriptional regulator n=1 Tax=Streptosporangium sp. NBC_01495 TaxID=2903899 RepID=UPI002E337AC2|nr:LuxR C-terminal-related transcriptional regulator [Streptosporangium sp. NBC_01495]